MQHQLISILNKEEHKQTHQMTANSRKADVLLLLLLLLLLFCKLKEYDRCLLLALAQWLKESVLQIDNYLVPASKKKHQFSHAVQCNITVSILLSETPPII